MLRIIGSNFSSELICVSVRTHVTIDAYARLMIREWFGYAELLEELTKPFDKNKMERFVSMDIGVANKRKKSTRRGTHKLPHSSCTNSGFHWLFKATNKTTKTSLSKQSFLSRRFTCYIGTCIRLLKLINNKSNCVFYFHIHTYSTNSPSHL